MKKNVPANSFNSPRTVNIQFWGLQGIYSATALHTLLAGGIIPQVVIIPDNLPGRPITSLSLRTQISLPVLDPAGTPDLIQLAFQNQIPILAVGDLNHPETHKTLTGIQPDIAIVACFDRRIPTPILSLARHGFLNIHPSLLPAYRGPAPLFWLFRDAAEEAMGVTIHQMDSGLDTGEIIALQPLTFADGISGREADQVCAREGANLIVDHLDKLIRSNVTTRKQKGNGFSKPWPTSADFSLETTWSARRAFNFMRATAEWQLPYSVFVQGQPIKLSRALAYQPDTPATALVVKGNIAHIRFRPGVLQASIY